MTTLIVLLGPTAVGKTELSIKLAKLLNCDIISADSRQMYRRMDIGTAKPTQYELSQVRHHFIDTLDITDYYSAAQYEEDVLRLIASQDADPSRPDVHLMAGGSMMYIDAVCNGIDDIPTVDEETRQLMKDKLQTEGLGHLCEELRLLDPEYYEIVDHKNTQRVVHALEICYMTGKTYTSFRKNKKKERPFRVIKVGLRREREELFSRINSRVEQMMQDGFLDEVRGLYEEYLPDENHVLPNALNTVGYKEMIQVIKGEWTEEFAVARMQKNTRVYAKKQMTWFQKDQAIHWFDCNQVSPQKILDLVNSYQLTVNNE